MRRQGASERASLLTVPRPLLVDEMLGRLARWLRVLGFDSEWVAGIDDGRVLEWARREDRVLLTRDTGIMRRRLVRDGRVAVVFVRYDRFEDQLAQLAHECGLARVDLPRCLVCNARLRAAGPFEAASHVPEYVARTQRHFRYCPTCDRYVWEGTHWRKMCTLLRRVGVAGA